MCNQIFCEPVVWWFASRKHNYICRIVTSLAFASLLLFLGPESQVLNLPFSEPGPLDALGFESVFVDAFLSSGARVGNQRGQHYHQNCGPSEDRHFRYLFRLSRKTIFPRMPRRGRGRLLLLSSQKSTSL